MFTSLKNIDGDGNLQLTVYMCTVMQR